MTAIRTYPPGTVLANINTVITKDNWGFQWIFWPLSMGPAPFNTAMNDYSATYPRGPFAPQMAEQMDLPDYGGWARINRPSSDQWYSTNGVFGTVTMDSMLKVLDFWHARGVKVLCTMMFYDLSGLGWNNKDPFTGAYETHLANCLEALFNNTQVSAAGYTFLTHPAVGAIEASNEATDLHTDTIGTAHALCQRIVYTKVKKYRPEVKVLGWGASGGASVPIHVINGAEARSLAQTPIGLFTADAANDRLTRTNHGLVNNDIIFVSGPGLPSGFADYNTSYKLNIIDANNFQLMTNTSTPTVVGNTTSSIVFAEIYADSNYGASKKSLTQPPAKYNPSTRQWNQPNHGLSTTRVEPFTGQTIPQTVRLKPYVAGGIDDRRYYYVKFVDANTIQLAKRLDGAAVLFGPDPDNINSFSVNIAKNTPAAIDGDDGVGRYQPEYCDAQSHHYYHSTKVMDPAQATSTKRAIRALDNVIPHERILNVSVDAVDHGERIYRQFGEMYIGAATVNTTANTLTLPTDQNPRAGERFMLQTTGLVPAGLAPGQIYYVVNPVRATKTFQLSLTSGGAAIDLTSAGAGSLYVYRLHPSYDTPVKKAVWNTEFSIVERPYDSFNVWAVWSALTMEERKVYLLRYAMASYMATTDGAGGRGVSIHYGVDVKDTAGADTMLFESHQLHTDGRLRINLSGATTAMPYFPNIRVMLRGGSAGIAGVVAPGEDKFFTVNAVLPSYVSGANTRYPIVLDTMAYTGNTTPVLNTTNMQVYFQQIAYGPFVPEMEWLHDLLVAGPVTFGWIYYPNQSHYGIMVHFTGQRPMYTTPDGVLHEW